MAIPEVLEPLVEFEDEETGEPVAVCGPTCGKSYSYGETWHATHDSGALGAILLAYKAGRMAHCPYCGTLVGFAADGRPYRIRFSRIVEALAHRDRALEAVREALGDELERLHSALVALPANDRGEALRGGIAAMIPPLERVGMALDATLTATEEE